MNEDVTDERRGALLYAADLAILRPPVAERGIARDHEHAVDPRQIGRQILGDAVGKIVPRPGLRSDWRMAARQSADAAAGARRLGALA
jgi:hypothetical protein